MARSPRPADPAADEAAFRAYLGAAARRVDEALEQARLEMETARRANDLARMSELAYGRIPELERQLKAGELPAPVGTSSLELGIDIGQLDVSIMAGYPGSMR